MIKEKKRNKKRGEGLLYEPDQTEVYQLQGEKPVTIASHICR